MSACVFCQIIEGVAPAKHVAVTDVGIIIKPLNPVTEGHLLAIPRVHVTDFAEDITVSAQVMRLAAYYVQSMGPQPANIITSRGEFATQTVMHLHLHIVPRREGDGLLLPWSEPVITSAEEGLRSDLKDARALGEQWYAEMEQANARASQAEETLYEIQKLLPRM